jgi:putative ABC transport system permease protein
VVGFGITPDWARNNWVYALRGRFLDWDDVARASRVCIVIEPGRWKKKPFWASLRKPDEFERHVSHNDMLGRRVLIGGHSFLVVGVLAPPLKDKDLRWFGRGREEKIVYLPITTCQRVLGFGAGPPPDRVDSIFVDAGSEAAVPSAKRTVESLLRARHGGEEDFDVRDWRETMQGAVSSVRKGCIAVLSVGVIAILAGGIGIMNVTLAVIFSRIREIGIRRAVGARRRDIMAQFVLEAMLLGLLGGIAGCALGLAGIAGLSPDGAEQMLSLRPWHLLGAVGIAVAAGLLFSLYPARQASRLEPVEALRFE